MNQLLIPLLNGVVVLFISIFQSANVSIRMDAPAQVTGGTEFEVRITLTKGDIEGFSRFQMDIPAGLTASSYISSNSDFTFSDKRVRMIWLRLPESNEFTFAYKIKVDERLKGMFTLDGKFSYIDNNQRKSVSLNPQTITIQPSPNIDPSLLVDINEFEEKVIQYIQPVSEDVGNIVCIRQKPYLNDSRDEYIVNILVNKEDKKKYAKIEEIIPAGYNAIALENNDAIFTFKNQKAKFMWMNLPAEPHFLVSYRLIPQNGAAPKLPKITGTFSYLVKDKTISIDIVENETNLLNLSNDEIQNLINDVKSRPVEIPTQQIDKRPGDIGEPISDKTPVRQIDRKRRSNHLAYLLEPEEGIYYRIQIAAGHKPVDIKRYFKKFNLDMDVRKEEHLGWIKYSLGSFKVYKDARDYRVHIWNTTIIDDAFVSAYNSGQRITVQEALMVANQKWYK